MHDDTKSVKVWISVIRCGVRQCATEPGVTRASPRLGRANILSNGNSFK